MSKRRLGLVPVLGLVLVAAFSASPVFGAGGPPAGVASHIIVFNRGVDAEATTADLARQHGLGVTHVYKHAISGAAAVVPPGRLKALESDSRVAYVEPNGEVFLLTHFGLPTVPTGIQRIFADANPNITIDGVDDVRIDVDIAIIDTGIDPTHPDLNVFKVVNCARGGPRGSCKENDGKDGHGHGSHVAGTAAALDNGIGVVGVAPGARLWGIKVLDNNGSGFTSWLLNGLDWLSANAAEVEVANMSLGYSPSVAMDTVIANTIAQGVVFAVAASNDAEDVNDSLVKPASLPDVITVSALADYNGVAGDPAAADCFGSNYSTFAGPDDDFASFSNFGSLIEIIAPGVCILSTYKDGGYGVFSGTSMASPHVAGAAALLASANPPFNRAGVVAIVQTLIANGNLNWNVASDPDNIHEPLLDVRNPLVFAPATVAGTSPPAGPQAPVAKAGPDQTVSDGDGNGVEAVTLDGSGSTDFDGTIDSYEWDFNGDGVTDRTGVSITANFDVGGSPHTVTLKVIDNDGLVGTDDVVITVNPNQSPTANAGPDQTVIDSDANRVETVTLHGSGSTDADGTIDSYEWDLNGDGVFDLSGISVTTGLTVAGSPHTVTLKVTDNLGDTGFDVVVVTVSDASAEPTAVFVTSPSGTLGYTTEGGKNGDKHLTVTYALEDDKGNPVAGASIFVELFLVGDTNPFRSGGGITGADGTLHGTVKNAPFGCYTTIVKTVSADGLTWDGTTPPNGFCK